MSNENEASPAQQVAATEESFEVHGKKFNLSTPEGKGELKGFLEAMSTELGRKNNEVGTLRKFAAAVKPDKDESEIIQAARKKAAEGDLDAALDSVFSFSKARINQVQQQAEMERQNSETWDAYLSARPDLMKIFDKRTIRRVSEVDLDIYNNQTPFETLDAYWMPKVKAIAPVAAPSEKPKAKTDVPPATLSGGSVASGAPKDLPVITSDPNAQKVDLQDIFDSVSYSRKLAAKHSK